MNKAKTLKRKLGNPKTFLECVLYSEGTLDLRTRFLSVAWDTEDIPSKVSVNSNPKWKDINWQRVEKNVFKLQELIYRASYYSGEIRKMGKDQRLLAKSYYPRLLAVRRVTQDNQGKETADVDRMKSLSPMQRFNLVDLWILNNDEYMLNQHSDVPIIRHIKVMGDKSPYDGDWTYWSSRTGKHPGVRKEVSTLLKQQKNKCAFCRLNFRPTDLIEVDHIIPRSKVGNNTYKNK